MTAHLNLDKLKEEEEEYLLSVCVFHNMCTIGNCFDKALCRSIKTETVCISRKCLERTECWNEEIKLRLDDGRNWANRFLPNVKFGNLII